MIGVIQVPLTVGTVFLRIHWTTWLPTFVDKIPLAPVRPSTYNAALQSELPPGAMAVDPTYPLYPVFCIIGAALMLLVFMTNSIRQSWNLGVTFLCFWLFWDVLFEGINAVIWSDNAEIKLYVYCDIGKLNLFKTYLCLTRGSLSIAHPNDYLCSQACLHAYPYSPPV
jgi:hypothetical protein